MTLFPALDLRRGAFRPGPLLPPAGARDAVLVFVVAVLTFLACATAIAAIAANRAAGGWERQLLGSASVIIRTAGDDSPDRAAERATEALAGAKGVEEARLLERGEAEDLLRPWIGDDVLQDLPIPRLIAVDLDREKPATAADLKAALAAAGVEGEVDDHSLWTGQIIRAGQMARIAALGVAALLALVTGAVIAHATRSAIVGFRDVVDVLHFSGAEDRFIGGLFVRRFAWLALRAAIYGALLAALLAAVLRLTGGPKGLTPVLPIAWPDLVWVAAAPLAAGLVAAGAARTAALALLRKAV